jgi:hypothetical protein
MGRVADYRLELRRRDDWVPFLLEHSRLPGPRANLELLAAVADEGSAERFRSLLAHGPDTAPSGSPGEFLAACGAAGVGESIARGDDTLWPALRTAASDPRWRVREAVAMGLQRIGDRDTARLLAGVRPWLDGGPLERRAVAAGLCEPRLLRDGAVAREVVEILDGLTRSLAAEEDRRSPEVRAFRKGLGYCWSVALAACPDPGRARFEAWAGTEDPDIRWVLRENLRKKRLQALGPDWVADLARRVG